MIWIDVPFHINRGYPRSGTERVYLDLHYEGHLFCQSLVQAMPNVVVVTYTESTLVWLHRLPDTLSASAVKQGLRSHTQEITRQTIVRYVSYSAQTLID